MVIESKNYNIFSFSLLTRDMPIINNGKAVYITVPTISGSISILSSHIPYISSISYGILHIKTKVVELIKCPNKLDLMRNRAERGFFRSFLISRCATSCFESSKEDTVLQKLGLMY